MKLLFCPDCWDVIKLESEIRKCKCGKCSGKYLENLHNAVTNGEGICLAFNNSSLTSAIVRFALLRDKREVTQADTCAFHFSAWVRDHGGPSNPRTIVDKTLGDESNA
jgi:hypothetical protein